MSEHLETQAGTILGEWGEWGKGNAQMQGMFTLGEYRYAAGIKGVLIGDGARYDAGVGESYCSYWATSKLTSLADALAWVKTKIHEVADQRLAAKQVQDENAARFAEVARGVTDYVNSQSTVSGD